MAPAAAAPDHLLVFARYPELGKVKTRLAAHLGDAAALDAYQQLLSHTRAVAQPLPGSRTLWLAAAPPTGAAPLWPDWPQRVQPPLPDLGQRMEHAFTQAFAAGAGRVVIIGTDCPGLQTRHLQEAFALLHTHEVVLGPAHDGGYYLLGMRQLRPELFGGIRWSTDTVLRDTLQIAHRLRLQVAQLPPLHDVDTAADWHAWQQRP
ncbi:TIGR04282 family arsenosugar biosynthesis glycosyltransferase [Hymenobacter latericus]|uniref:TIGR04282 family arsenosugar biosynthesis glycosyltransferase n=1 Tax=Hymenobacter sp. YIM 151858-1 TaxID=2987688 RepID=UPI002226BA69|nr:TIGR04282 family arsenosugar biosynthesis glycosyltransferase [Hymenobacter sp. YIM 151858-1]UYZ60488.1 TIGR04282 family arsenosugar biosynthesis glycosyltransferase [Hymenobacter sp. YIM 151858-1]